MSQIFESRKVDNKNLMFLFKFTQFDLKIGSTNHKISLDKWLTLDDWTKIFNELEPLVQEYFPNQTITTDRNIIINSNLSLNVSWIRMNTSLALFCGMRSATCYDYYIKIKVNCVSSFTDHLKNVEQNIDSFKCGGSGGGINNDDKPSIPLQLKSKSSSIEICIDSNVNNNSEKESSDISIKSENIDEEYIPTLPKDSASVNLIAYVPSKKENQTDLSNNEYTPTKSDRSSSAEYSVQSCSQNSYATTVYCPGGSKRYEHEPYNPTISLSSISELSDKSYQPSPNKSPESSSANVDLKKDDSFNLSFESTPKKENCKKNPESTDDFDVSSPIMLQNLCEPVLGESPKSKKLKTNKRKDIATNNGSSEDLFGDSDSDSCVQIAKARKKSKLEIVVATPRTHLMRKSKTTKLADNVAQITNYFSPNIPASSSSSSSSLLLKQKSNDATAGGGKAEWYSKAKAIERKKKEQEEKDRLKSLEKEKKVKKKRIKTLQMTEEELKNFTENHRRKMEAIESKRALLDFPSSPESVEIKTLKHVTTADFLKTYPKHKKMMADFVKKYINRTTPKLPKTFYLDHFVVLTLVTDDVQLRLLSFLNAKFEQKEGIPSLDELFWDTILPEWVLEYFMEEYNFTREEALKQISDQQTQLANQSDTL